MESVKKNLAPWESYYDEVVGRDSPDLEAAVNEYATKRHDRSSSETLEELARLEEGNREIARQYQFVKPEDYADLAARMGTILTYEQFITRLRDQCKLKCFYREMNHPQKLALWAFKNGEPEVACWCQRPYMIELEVVRFDRHGAPLDSRFRGWRTCLMDLVRKGFLTEEKVYKVFGPANNSAGGKYNQFMQEMRKIQL